jgi:ketosteroid isomerase-like protein
MSQSDIEAFYAAVRAFAERDLEAMAEQFTDDAVVRAPEGWPESGPYVGKEAVMRNFALLQEDWAEHDMTVTSVLERDGQFVARMIWDVLGRGSGLRSRLEVSVLHRFRDGKISVGTYYLDHDQALRDAGVSE